MWLNKYNLGEKMVRTAVPNRTATSTDQKQGGDQRASVTDLKQKKNLKARTGDPNIKPDSSVGRGHDLVGGDLIRSGPESKTTRETVIKAEEP